MSRYYRIAVGPETEAPVGQDAASGNAGAVWTNLVAGKADLGAQRVELDVWAFAFDAPISQAYVRIWGPSKEQISQASDFNGAPISVYAGMQKGLPLATSDVNDGQQGIILKGQIFQAFGNWQGINQTLDFVVTTDGGATQSEPANLSLQWKQGTPLSQALQQTLSTAYPEAQVKINISDSLVLTQDEHGVYQTIQQLAAYAKGVSLDIQGRDGTYQGVSITREGDVIRVFDGTGEPEGELTTIDIKDMIGQPTWLDAATVQFNTVMRADLSVGSLIKFPPLAALLAVTTPQSGSNARAKNTFAGNWTVTNMRHVGDSRAPDAQSWISTFQAISDIATAAETSVANTSA